MTFEDYIEAFPLIEQKEQYMILNDWVKKEFPELRIEMKWNQPMFIYKETFIIAFSYAKKHISVAPEKVILDQFIDRIKMNHTHTKMLFHIKWGQDIAYDLLKDIIQKSIIMKQSYTKFWL